MAEDLFYMYINNVRELVIFVTPIKKDVYNSSWNLRATERHLPYGITQCYLPRDTGERAPP